MGRAEELWPVIKDCCECCHAFKLFYKRYEVQRPLTGICKTRYASMPLFDAAMLEGAMDVNWRLIDRRIGSIARIVNKAGCEQRRLTAPLFHFQKGRKAESDTGILTAPGHLEIFRASEVYLAPVEGTRQEGLSLSLRQRDS